MKMMKLSVITLPSAGLLALGIVSAVRRREQGSRNSANDNLGASTPELQANGVYGSSAILTGASLKRGQSVAEKAISMRRSAPNTSQGQQEQMDSKLHSVQNGSCAGIRANRHMTGQADGHGAWVSTLRMGTSNVD